MLLIGACRQSNRPEAALAVVDAALSRGRKRYSLLEIDEGIDADPAAFVIDDLSASALALALVFCFRETVPYRRAYRAN